VWTFFITIILLFGWFGYIPFMVFMSNRDTDAGEEQRIIEEVTVPTTTYYCTSKKGLKVREYPSTSAPQLGSLTYGEATEVYEIEGSFAKIKYDKAESGEAWVSSKYISQTPPYSN
ncbi:MAG: SH3 domain-containing protein, partial [Bacteroidaceae bacterium]|nr:SH3 domain-containing protein [Bacteroidaceae bacterium]